MDFPAGSGNGISLAPRSSGAARDDIGLWIALGFIMCSIFYSLLLGTINILLKNPLATLKKFKVEDKGKDERIASQLAQIEVLKATETNLQSSAADNLRLMDRTKTSHSQTISSMTGSHARELERVRKIHIESLTKIQDSHAEILERSSQEAIELQMVIEDARERTRLAEQERRQKEEQATALLGEVEGLRPRVGAQQDQIRELQRRVQDSERKLDEAKNRNTELAMRLTHATAAARRRPGARYPPIAEEPIGNA